MWRIRLGRGFGPVVWQITDDDDDDEVYMTFSVEIYAKFALKSLKQRNLIMPLFASLLLPFF